MEAVPYFDDPQPGIVEAYLTDSDGFRWQIVEKTVLFEEWRLLGPTTVLGPVSIECRVVLDRGGPCVLIDLPDCATMRTYTVERGELIDDGSESGIG